jgi:hypothetical protein
MILKIMNRILNYLLLSGLIGVGIYAAFTAVKVDEKPKTIQFVTRSAVDSTQVRQYIERLPQPVSVPEPIPWAEITTAIVSITIAAGSVNLKRFKSKIFDEIRQLKEQMQIVADQKNRDNVDAMLVKIEQDAAGWVDDENLKALIEGIGSRTRSFVRDVMQMDFNDDCLEKAVLKMGARTQDGKHQVKDLGFSNYFEGRINEIRCVQLKQLKIDLTRLVNDKLHNSKYERFGEIICRFQRNYMKEVVKLSHEIGAGNQAV